jgi:hypothetical protein
MSKPETLFWKKLKKRLPSGHIIRVENPAHPGTPDINGCIRGVEIWMELKQVPALPKRDTTPVFTGALRPEQVLWHTLRWKAGGRSYIVAYVEEQDLIYTIEGEYAKEFNDMPKARLDELNLPLETVWISNP